MKIIFTLVIIFTFSSCSVFQTKKKNWADFTSPFEGATAAIGSSSAGCLSGAKKIDENPQSFILMRPSRGRLWGHTLLLSFLYDLALKVNKSEKSLLLIGDLTQPRGGRMRGNHVSHQTGLDVDLWFELPSEIASTFSREEYSARSLVKEPLFWTEKQEKLVQLIAEDSRTERVFINPELKKRLCLKYKGASWLHYVRPWWGHDDHLHVRLTCPASDVLCEKGPNIVQGDGCGEDLAWWFTDEAKTSPVSPTTTSGGPIDRTPPVCEPLRASF